MRQVNVIPGGAIGQSAVVVHVGTHSIPIGVALQAHPREPGGHAPVQSAVVVHARGPMPPASVGIAASPVGTPPSPGGIIIIALKLGSGAAWKHRGMYGNVLVST